MVNCHITQETSAAMSEDDALLLKNQVCFPLYSAANAVIRAYRPMLEELELTYVQYLVMMILWQTDGMNVKQLGEQLNLDSGTLTPLLKRLESKHYLTRTISAHDERVRIVCLTEEGKALRQRALSVPAGMFCKLKLDPDELITLKTLCEKVIHTLEE